MGFETVVLKKVEDVLGTDNAAQFCYGSLFVECTEDEARKVFHRLSKDMFGKVLVSKAKTSPEYVFDFTA
jgi:hypothetical protein